MDNLRNLSINAVLWGTGGTVLRILIQVVSQVVLARLLGPEQFGLFATGLVVVFLTNLFADAGLAYGLVQRKVVTDENIRFIFTWQVITSAAIAVVLYWCAPLLAAAFGDSRLEDVLRWLALASIVTATGGTANALLKREMDFRTLNIAGVVSYAIAFLLVGIPMALAGFEVMALITAFILQAFIVTVISYGRVRHPIRPLLRDKDARRIIGFGATVFATNVVNWFMTNLDRAIVSAFLGVTAAGLYSTMSNLINVPAQSALAVLQPVFYSASSKVQGNVVQLRQGLRVMCGAVVLFVAPVFVAISIAAHTVVLAVYGTKWLGGEVVLTPLSLAIPIVMLMGFSTPVLWTAGFPRREFQVQLPMTIVWAAVCFGASQSGSLAVVSWAVFAMLTLRAAIIFRLTMMAVELRFGELLGLFAPGLFVSGLVGVAAATADAVQRLIGIGPHLGLLMVVAACAVAMLSGLRIVRTLFPVELKDLLGTVADRVPDGSVRQAVGRILGV